MATVVKADGAAARSASKKPVILSAAQGVLRPERSRRISNILLSLPTPNSRRVASFRPVKKQQDIGGPSTPFRPPSPTRHCAQDDSVFFRRALRAAWLAVAAGVIFVATASAHAQGTAHKGFDDFKLVKTRNIFDPNRRASRSEAPRDSRSTSRITRANTLSLTGTMAADGRTLAFFGGSRSEYSKVIGVGEMVADYKVKSIAPTQVELERDGKVAVLAVGKLLTLEGTTEVVVEGSTPPADPAAPATTAAPDAPAESAPTNDKNEILRRMMERRAKEMNK